MLDSLKTVENEIKELEDSLSSSSLNKIRNQLRLKRLEYWKLSKKANRENPGCLPEIIETVKEASGAYVTTKPMGDSLIYCLGQWNKEGDLPGLVRALNIVDETGIQVCPKCFKEMALHGVTFHQTRGYNSGWKTTSKVVGVCPGDYILKAENPGEGNLITMNATAYYWFKRSVSVQEFVESESKQDDK